MASQAMSAEMATKAVTSDSIQASASETLGQDEIAALAYECWQRRGMPDWITRLGLVPSRRGIEETTDVITPLGRRPVEVGERDDARADSLGCR